MSKLSTNIATDARPENSQSTPRYALDWQQVTRHTPELGKRFLEVMAQMDSHYAEGDWKEPFEIMVGDDGRYFVGDGCGFEVVIGYLWHADHAIFQIRSVGFRGQIQPYQALEITSDHLRHFLQENGQSHAYTVLPPRLDSPCMMQFCALVPWFREWKITGGRYVEGGTYWKIQIFDIPKAAERRATS